MIIEQLKKANVIDSTGKVTLANLATYTLTHDILVVMYDGTVNNITGTYLRAVIEKWTFQDKAMGEQFITFDFLSEQPVAWAVNDYCIFRGERFVLNYIPSVTQKGRRNAVLDSYKYEGVKLNSLADELTRCQMLDVVLTSGQHDPDAGTNHTGSSQFPLFCGETTVNGVTRTAVMTLGDRILANLNRMYGENVWSIVYGDNTHTEDQQLSFDNQYVSEALAEVKNKFDLNYAVKGRTIYIGCELGDVAGVEYGFGPGYPTDEAGGKGLFELKKISDSSQQIVTRLRVLGSTKNLPYRYYNNAYPLPQALFPLNLQLPDTFLPEGSPSDPAGANTKWGHNKQRSSQLRAVKGATNDAYIDKGDDAAATTEGIREATIRFDGSDSKLEEIYPTIENVTYDELRGSNVPDQDGNTGPEAYPNYESDEKVNEILAIGYKYDGQMFDDANIGSGILSENNGGQAGSIRDISISQRLDSIRTRVSDYFCGTEQILFTIAGQTAGKYFFTPVMSKEPYFSYSPASVKDRIGFIIRVKATSGGITTTIAEYKSDFYSGRNSVALPSIPDVFYMMDAQVREIALSGTADITVTFIPCAKASTDILYGVGPKPNSSYTAQYVWNSVDNMDSSGMPFHFFVKDMGFDFAAQFNGETPTIVMKSGDCVGREFQIGQSIEKVEYQGKKGYMLTLNRASDSSLNTYYPNARNQISADDQFVITGIDMPDAYIKAAEMRLLSAATEWLAENGNTNFHYQPAIDDIYLKRNYENMVKAGTPQDSVFWKIYAGYDLTFHPIPDNPSDPEPEAISVTIESVTITMGEGLTRKVDILLNDELKESTLKRVSREVKDLSDKIQRTGSGMSTATMETAIRTIGDKQYLSKVENDTAAGDITFNGNIRFNKDALFAQGAYFGENLDGSFNTEIDALGNIQTARNVEAMWGVAAYGMASLAMNGGGGQGTVTAINFAGSPERIYTPSDGLITLPDYPSLDGYATQAWVTNNFADKAFEGRVTTIESKIPAQASSTNQLADKNFVNSSVATATAEFQGTYDVVEDLGLTASATHAQIQSALLTAVASKQPDNNDYVFVSIPAVSGASGKYERYKFNGTSWAYEYTLNNSSFTAAQWASITSGITSAKVSDYDTHIARTDNPHGVTKAQVGLGNVENTALSTWTGTIKIVTLGTITTGIWHGSAIADDYIASASAWNAKYDKDPNGIPLTDLASDVRTSLGKADSAIQGIKVNGGSVITPDTNKIVNITDVASGTALSGVTSRVGDLEGYFDANGVANNAAKLGGQLPSYYAAAADYTKTSDFQSFSIKVGTTTLGTYSPTSALILSLVAGSNIAFDTDATNHKLTIRNTYSYTLPMASSDSRGGIRVGNTLNIDSNGILNANIYDGLDQGYTTYALSAKQGKALNTALGTLKTGLTSKGAHNLPIYLNSNAQAVAIDALSVSGNVESTAGGVSAMGIASLALNGGGGQGTLTQIQVNGVALADTSGVVNITATTGNAAGKIAIAGQQIPVYGLGSFAYLSSLAFTDLSSHPTTLGEYGITDAKIANGVITLGGNTITPITSLPTFYNLAFQNGNSVVDTYKPTTSPSKTIKAGSNVTISAASNVITIAATDTTYESKAAASGGTAVSLVTTGEKYTWNNKGTYSKPSGGIPATDLAESYYLASNPNGYTKTEASTTNGKIKINGTDTTVYTHPTTAGNKHIPSGGSSGQFLGYDSAGTAKWVNNPNTDTKVTQTVTTSSNTSWRPLLIGQSYSDASPFAPTTTTDTVYATHLAKFAPKDGLLAIRGLNKMNTDGTLATGSENKVFNTNGGVSNLAAWAQADSKPSYTYSEVGAAASSHTHGNIQNGGALQTNDVSIANGDKLVITDASDSAKIARSGITFDASTTNKALTPKGTWESFLQGNQTITLSGDVSGSGATSIAVTIGASKVTNAMLAGSIANNKLANSSISIAGTSVSLGGSITAATLKSNLGLGASAYVGYDTTVTKDSAKLITSGAVWTAIDNLPEPMVFKGSLGTGGTITALPVNGSASIGDTYKVITAGTYASKAAKVGDTFICLTKTSSANTWELIPSGDEPSGTVTSVGLSMPTGFSISSSPVTTSGTLTVAFASGYSLPTTAKQGNWDDAYDKRHTHSSLTLSTTAQAYDGTHTLALPASDPYTSARTPSSHASSGTGYGVGTTSNYGHVKLATGDMNGASGADGVACGKNHTHSQYLPLAGGTMTGAIKRYYGSASDDPVIALSSYNLDTWLWQINHSGSVSTGISYGFGLKYLGTGAGNDNTIALFADNQGSTQVKAFEVKQDGTIRLAVTPNVNGNTVLHAGNSSVSLSGSTLTVKINDTSKSLTNTDRYVNSAAFAHDSTNDNVKMTLTRAGSDTATVTANIPKVSSSSAGVAPKGAAVSSQSQTTKFLREDGTWAAPSYTTNTDTKNTTGGDDTSSKIFLVGMTAQTTSNGNSRTYTQDTAYVGTDGHLYSNSKQVVNLTDTQAITNKTYNGLTLTAQTTGFYIGGGNTTAKTLIVNDNYTLQSACGHAHEDYVTTIGTSGNTLTWSKGGTAQTAITVPYATAAGKLNTNAGSATNPVYFANGVPVACTYSLNKTVPADAVFTDHTYNFSGATFYSGNGSNAEHNANSAVKNGNYYYSSGGPATSLGASTSDGALYVQSYSDDWVGQIAQDYRNGRLFVRGKKEGTWQSWVRIAQTGEAQPASDVYAWAKASTKPSYSFSEISSRGEAFLEWGGANFSGSYGPIDAAMVPELGGNRLAFMPVGGITIQYSRDGGSTWTDYGASNGDKLNLFDGVGTSLTIGKASSGSASTIATNQYQLKVSVFTGAANVYTTLNKFVIYVSTNGTNANWVTIRCRTQQNYEGGVDTWVVRANKVGLSGWSGYNVINITPTTTYGNTKSSQYGQWEFIFGCDTGATDTRYAGLTIYKIFGYGGVGWTTPSTMAKTGHLYSYDASQNAYFPAGVSATSFTENGTALSSKYLGINANAVSATKATQDGDGNTISSTYLKLSGGTMAGTVKWNSISLPQKNSSPYAVVIDAFASGGEMGWRQLGSNAFDSTAYLPLAGGTMANTTVVTNLNADLLDGQHGSYYQPKVSALGSTTEPVYISAAGTFSKASKYAGGTAVTLNGTSAATITASFYAPTGAGTSGQILKSSGSGAPTWANQSTITAGALTTVSKTAWGRTYWTSGGVPDNISGDMSNVGNIAFSASGKNIGGTMYFDTTNHRIGINDSTPSCAFDVTGDVQASGGVAAGGILNLAYNGAGTQGTLTQIQINGRALTDTSGIVNIPLANTTSTGDGAMSHSDKLKLDGIATGATNVTTDTVAGWGYIKNAAGIQSALGYIAARETKKSRLVTGNEYRFQTGDNDCINIWIVSAASVNLYLPYDWDYQTPLRLIIANSYSGTVTVNYKATSGTQKIYSQSATISLSTGRAALVEMIQFYNASVGGEVTFVTSTSYLQRSIT